MIDVDALTGFNETVTRLERTKLTQDLEAKSFKIELPHTRPGFEVVLVEGISEDDVCAFVLLLRILIQDRDAVSIRYLANNVYSESAVPEELRKKFEEVRDSWNSICASGSVLGHPTEPRNFTHGELFDVLLYGHYAHIESSKRAVAKAIRKQPGFMLFVNAHVFHMLRTILGVVRAIRDTNREVLERLPNAATDAVAAYSTPKGQVCPRYGHVQQIRYPGGDPAANQGERHAVRVLPEGVLSDFTWRSADH